MCVLDLLTFFLLLFFLAALGRGAHVVYGDAVPGLLLQCSDHFDLGLQPFCRHVPPPRAQANRRR
jgi:hypothetical protein